MRARSAGLMVVACVLWLIPLTAPMEGSAQDLEVVSEMTGIPLPQSYYDELRRDPTAFQIQHGWIARAEEARQVGAAVEGTLPVLIIPILFSDSPEPWITPEEMEQNLFRGPADHGTLTGYYDEVSGGRLEVTGSVTPWIRTDVSLADAVSDNFGLGGNAELGEVLWQALEAADTLVDFGAFDNDGPDGIPNSGDDDGFVDVVAFQFIEVAASCGGPAPWPHRWRMAGWKGQSFESRATRPDGTPIRVNDYIIQSAVVCSGESIQTPATIAHELGHILGLPDLYDSVEGLQPEERRWVVGCWGIMAAGAWGCGDPTVRSETPMPPHMVPWSKEQLGWIDFVEVEPGIDREVTLDPVRESGQALRVPLSGSAHLHVEYRVQEGYDRDIPDSGVMIYHIDRNQSVRRSGPDAPLLYRVMVLEADGNESLLRNAMEGGNRGEPGDAWARESPGLLTNATHPSSRRHDESPSSAILQDIRIEDGRAVLRVSTQAIPHTRLLRTLLGTSGNPLTDAERLYLDRLGNRNGLFDLGDIRSYLRHQPTSR
jgi:M6 family metalloprotease-like protein